MENQQVTIEEIIKKQKENYRKSDSKLIKRAYNDTTAISIVFYGMVYLIILFFEELNNNVYNNIYVIVGFFILTLLYELFLSLSVYSASKETSEILNKKK